MILGTQRVVGPRRLPRPPARLLALALLVVALLVGCGDSGAGSGDTAGASSGSVAPGTVTTAPDGVQEITLTTGDDYRFSPSEFTVAPGEVRITVTNNATQYTHNFLFTEGAGPAPISEQIPVLAPGDSTTIDITVTTPGDYPFECSFHVALGQVGVMTVSG